MEYFQSDLGISIRITTVRHISKKEKSGEIWFNFFKNKKRKISRNSIENKSVQNNQVKKP
jgi:hypothetical protein